jgi:nitrogen regulatory protein P-II 1
MQLISAVVRPTKVGEICDALQTLGFHGLTVTDATGHGKIGGHTEIYRGAKYSSGFQQSAKLEIITRDEDVHDLIDTICAVAFTGKMGDGKIWVTPVGELIRIRTRESDTDAL